MTEEHRPAMRGSCTHCGGVRYASMLYLLYETRDTGYCDIPVVAFLCDYCFEKAAKREPGPDADRTLGDLLEQGK